MNCKMMLLNILIYTVSAITFRKSIKENSMYILIGEETFSLNLIENQITEELISILPLKTKSIKKDSAKIKMPLNLKIDTNIFETENSPIKGKKGDIILFKGEEIIILNESIDLKNESGDFIKIGICENIEMLFNKIGNNKTILLWNTWDYENNKGKVGTFGKYNSIMNYFTWKIFTFFCFILI